MKFRIGLVAFIILVALIGAAVFLFLPKGGAKNGIYFNTYEGVYAKITGSVRGNANSITLSDLTYGEGASPTADELASWQVNLEFGEEDEITITINVENKNTNSLYVIFKDDKQTINNVTKTILNDGRPYTSGSIVVLQSDTDTTLFTITFRRDQDVITSIRYNYHIELKVEVTDADIQDGSIEAEESSGYTYEFNNKKNTATITGLSASNTETNLVLPNMVEHDNQLYLITTIGNDAFKNKTTITSVTIPNTVTELKASVFEGCTNLTNVAIPTSVTKLGSKVFKDCSNLITIELPNTISSIGTNLFSGCTKLTNYNIPTSLTSLGSRMFENCTRITEFTFPTQITTLGDYVFNGLGFETLTIPDTITTLTENSFSGITNIGELTLSCYVTSLEGANNGLFTGVTNIDKAIITANNNGTELGAAFCGASTLQEVEMSTGVTTIGSYAFSGCNNLTEVAIPDGVTSIGGNAFNSCEGVTEFTIPNTVTSIGEGAFRCCYALTNIEIPEGVESIGVSAFCYCTALINVEISDSVLVLGSSAFENCQNLLEVTFGDNSQLVTVSESAFKNCVSLTHIEIPNSVTFIGAGTFSGCGSLESMTLPFVGQQIKTASDTYQHPLGYIFGTLNFDGAEKVEQHYYYSNTTSTTKITYYIPSLLKTITITGGNILFGAFYNCSMLVNVVLPNNLTKIGQAALLGCDNLETIMIPNSVTEFGTAAFKYCSHLYTIKLPTELQTIKSNAFEKCYSLAEIYNNSSLTLTGGSDNGGIARYAEVVYDSDHNNEPTRIVKDENDGAVYYKESDNEYYVIGLINRTQTTIKISSKVSKIRAFAFYGMSNLLNVNFDENSSLQRIGESAFEGCLELTKIEIPKEVTTIGNNAFKDCSKIEGVYISSIENWINISFGSNYGNPIQYSKKLYFNNQLLTNLVIPQSVLTIRSDAFMYCESLTRVSCENNSALYSIGSNAFWKCINITDISLPDTVSIIQRGAFGYCSSLKHFIIPAGVTALNNNVFESCKGMEDIFIHSGVVSVETNQTLSIGYATFGGCKSTLMVYTDASSKPNRWYLVYGSSVDMVLQCTTNFSLDSYLELIQNNND